MRKRRILYFTIFVLAVIMAVILFYFLLIMQKPLLDHVKFRETVCNQEIDFYHDETDDIYYLFLPAYATTQELKIENSGVMKVNFSDDEIDYGNDLAAAPLETNLTMTLTNFYQRETYTVQLWKCDQLSTVYVETDSGNLDYVNEDKENEEDASVLFVNAEGDVEFSGMSVITGRGNTTWGRPKNPYNLKFSNNITVLGFEDIDTLCLLANYFDYSCLRDAVVHYAARKNDIAYSSDYEYVNLYINGNFMGLYAIATKEEYKKHIEEDDIIAAFEVTRFGQEEKSFQSENGTNVEVIYGDALLTENIINDFENALIHYDYERAFRYMDVESFAKKYVLEEFFLNNDMTWESSQYYYIDKSGTIHCMCAWDYDRSFGFSQRSYYNNHPEYDMVVYYRNNISWYKYLIQNQDFCNEVEVILNNDYSDSFVKELNSFMELCISEIESSWQCNNVRWKHVYNMDTLGFESLQDFYEFYHQVISCRGDFLKDYFLNQENYCIVSFYSESPQIYANICVPYGEKLSDYLQDYSLMGIDQIGGEKFLGWYTEDGGCL